MDIYVNKTEATAGQLLGLSDELYGGVHASRGIKGNFHFSFGELDDTCRVTFEIVGTDEQIAFIKLIDQSFGIVKIEPARDGEEYENQAIQWWRNARREWEAGRDVAPPIAPSREAEVRTKTNGLAVTSLVLGIITVAGGCANPIVGIPFAIGAFITGRIGSRRVKDSDGIQTGEKLALAGMILGGVGLVISLVSTAALILAILVSRES